MPGMCSRQALHTRVLSSRWNVEVGDSISAFRPSYTINLNIIIESIMNNLNALHSNLEDN